MAGSAAEGEGWFINDLELFMAFWFLGGQHDALSLMCADSTRVGLFRVCVGMGTCDTVAALIFVSEPLLMASHLEQNEGGRAVNW